MKWYNLLNPAWMCENVFTLYGGGKSDSPDAPDYTKLAQQQAQSNLDAVKYATEANRIDQYTPYGSLTYQHKPQGGGFDQAGYNKALAKYQQDLAAYNSHPQAPGGGTWGALTPIGAGGRGVAPVAPNRAQYTTSPTSDKWSSTVNLSPVGQQLLDYQNQTSLGLGAQTQNALGRVNDSLSQPFDYGSVKDTQDAAYKAYTDRLDPQWQENSNMIENKLANQGIPVGSEAYNNAMRTFNQGKNDAYSQANLGAIQTAPQTYQLAQALRSQPLNELNALRTGSQVQNPTFGSTPQQANTSGVDYLGAGNSAYQAALGNANASNAASSNLTNGLFSLGAAAIPMMFSDIRLKSNIVKVDTHPLGFGIYEYDIFGHRERGVMAQEVEKVIPDAVIEHPNGYKMVNYAKIPSLRTLH